MNIIQNKFAKVVKTIEEGNLVEFLFDLKAFYDVLTCNCFFRSQDQNIFKNLLDRISGYEDWKNKYEINLIKGFVYYLNKKETESYFYLTRAIGYTIENDISFSLRAHLDCKINPNKKEDAINAVLLNPSPRNYFILAGVLTELNEFHKARLFYDRATLINPEFKCAYVNRASLFLKKWDYKNAILDYKKCLEIDPDLTTIYMLWDCHDKSKRYNEAIEYAKLGEKTYPGHYSFKYALGVANERVENFEIALQCLNEYLEMNPGCKNG